MRARTVIALVALCAVAACVVVAGESSDDVVSPQLQRILQEDHAAAMNVTDKTQGLFGIRAGTTYHANVATKLFWHSVSAYCTTNAALRAWTCSSCKQFGPFTVTGVMDTQTNVGYVGYFTQGLPASPIDDGTGRVKASDPFVVVSFRGTVPSLIKNWIENLSAAKINTWSAYPNAKVHAGFFAAYSSLKADMLTAVKKALQASGAKTILVTGHSLGGAMAELAAIDMKLTAFPGYNIAAYTQGTPRVGNADFSTLFTAQLDASFREVHQADVVPHLPPLLLDFQHGPQEIWYDEGFSAFRACTGSEDKTCSNSIALPVSVADHISYRGVEMGGYCNSHLQTTQQPGVNATTSEPTLF